MEFERLKECVFELLFQHNCVIIPGFGGFITNYKSAGFEDSRLLIYPSRKRLAFNQNLNQNDGLLVNQWSIIKSISYQEALTEVEAFGSYLNTKIHSSKSFDFKNLGTFYQNPEKNLLFLPFQGLNFHDSSFGLEPLKIKLLTVIPSGVMIQSVVEPVNEISTLDNSVVLVQKHKNNFLPRLLKYAAVFSLLVLSAFTLVYLSDKYGKKTIAKADQNNQNASIINTDSNLNQELRQEEKQLVVPEYGLERQQLVEIKNKLSHLSSSGANQHASYMVISGYYETEKEASGILKKLTAKFEHTKLKVNSEGKYYIFIETFFKHTTAENFSVMLAEMGFKEVQVESENN